MPVLMTLARIVLNDLATRRNLIFLKEVEGERQFAIEIGMCEARSIDRKIEARPPRDGYRRTRQVRHPARRHDQRTAHLRRRISLPLRRYLQTMTGLP